MSKLAFDELEFDIALQTLCGFGDWCIHFDSLYSGIQED